MARDRTNARYLPNVPLEALVTPVPLDLAPAVRGSRPRGARGAVAFVRVRGDDAAARARRDGALADEGARSRERPAAARRPRRRRRARSRAHGVPDRAEPRRGDRTRTSRGVGAREPEPGCREEAAVAADGRDVPRLSLRRRGRRAALRRGQERGRGRGRRLGRARLRRQREGRADDPRAGRDGAPRRGVRRRSAHLRRARGHGRPGRHVHLAPLAQPRRRRADRQGRRALGDRGPARDGHRGPDDRALAAEPRRRARSRASDHGGGLRRGRGHAARRGAGRAARARSGERARRLQGARRG